MRKYQKIDEADEENVNGENSIPKQSGSALDKLKAAAAAPPPPPLTLKVLNKESSHHLAGGLTLQSTILQLKLEIERVIEVPIAQQRLIYAGKSLKPDDKTLASFKVENNSTIHLFPLPPTTVSSVSSNANGESSWTGGNNTESLNGHILSLHAVFEPTIPYPIYFDPEVSTHSREVRLWSVILIFLSGMTLFNNLSYNLSSGKFGNGVLDSIVSVTESTASAIGLYVAQLGLNSVRSMDLPTIRKYLEWLQGLAVLCVCMRILWVWDVVVQVQQAVENAKSRTNGTGTGGADAGGNGGSSGGSSSTKPPSNPGIFGDDVNVDPTTLTDQVVTSFALQATLIALVCIAAWANCVYRARLFQNSVAHYNDSNTTTATTTNTTDGTRSSSTGNSHELATATVTAAATAAGSAPTQTSTPVAIAINGPSAV